MSLKVYPLDVGDLQLDNSFVTWQSNCGTVGWYPTTAWLITGSIKPIVIDSSFRDVDDAKRLQGLVCRRSKQQTLEFQLGRHGLRPADIGYLVHTHVHMDHAGQDHLLPDAKILVQRRELQNAAAPDLYPVPFYDRLNVARLIDELWPRVEVLDGDCELFPGIRAVTMPGHTPGHQAIYVDTSAGTVIVAGDAAMNVRYNIKQLIPPGFLDDMPAVMRGLRKLAREGQHCLCTHDPEVFELYKDGVG